MKTCTKCGKIKELIEFKRYIRNHKEIFTCQCKQCLKDIRKKIKIDIVLQLEKEIKSSIIIENKILAKQGKKICSRCKKIYILSSLQKQQCRCLDCQKEVNKIWYKKNIVQVELKRNNKKEYLKQYIINNKEKIKEYKKQYYYKKKLEKENIAT